MAHAVKNKIPQVEKRIHVIILLTMGGRAAINEITMVAKKPETNFNEFFPWLWDEAQRQNLNKGEWMTRSKIDPQRWVEFGRAAGIKDSGETLENTDVSVYYFEKLTRGLGLSKETVQTKSEIKFTPEQLAEFENYSWYLTNKEVVVELKKAAPEKVNAVLSLLRS
jgi:hypothetical protein